MSYNTFIGVDPGANGAAAFIPANGEMVYTVPTKEPLVLLRAMLSTPERRAVAFLEKVHSMPGQGVASSFSFGRNYGHCEAALAGSGYDWDYVTPTIWQRAVGIEKVEGETRTQKKNRHKRLAQKLFPDVMVTHQNADALLIAEYCRRVKRGDEQR